MVRPFVLAGAVLGLALFSSSGQTATTPATLADFWAGSAAFTDHATLSLNAAGHLLGGPRIEVASDGWYLLYTDYAQADCRTWGLHGSLYSRRSTDQGASWGAPVLLAPAGNGRCIITDGDVYYDPAIGKWRAMYQCLTDRWDGCYFETPSLSTPFSEPVANPVISDAVNPLWKKLRPNTGTHDAGTWEIIGKTGSYFYVGFHGYEPSTGRGYRGYAKTTNFRSWTPISTYLGQPNQWLQNGAGFGHASTLFEDGQYYTVAEGMDGTLLCGGAGQEWAVGMFRSGSIGGVQTGLPAGNPFLDDGESCSPAYATLFKDGGETFISYYRIDANNDIAGLVIKRLTRLADVCEINTRVNGVESGWRVVDCGELP